MRAVRILVTGRVQGVFFRKSTLDQALRLGLKGYVMNLPDGRVLVEAGGEPAAIEALISWCRQGPPGARVQNIEVDETEAPDVPTFVIKR
jgi:acylphosphatase